MSRRNSSNTRTWVLLSLLSTPTTLVAEHPYPLETLSPFGTQTSPTNNANNKGCQDRLDENNIESLCESKPSDVSIFDNEPILSLSTQIDIRPESCLSFFDDYLHTRRGLRIESALHTAPLFSTFQATVTTFPVIDFIDKGHAHVVKSKDLASKIYTRTPSASPLFESIMADAEDINDRILELLTQQKTITAKSNGESTSLRLSDIRDISLHIVIQSGLATDHQIEQIRLAEAELKKRWGLNLKVIEIP